MATTYSRKGRTAKHEYSHGPAGFFGWRKGTQVVFYCDIGASGGISEVEISVDAESFRDLALAMIQADREAAIEAFGAALQHKPLSARMRYEAARNAAAEANGLCAVS